MIQFIIHVEGPDMAEDTIPTADEAPSKGPPMYDTAGISPGGQVYTNTEIGKLFYGGKA